MYIYIYRVFRHTHTLYIYMRTQLQGASSGELINRLVLRPPWPQSNHSF